MAVSSVGHLPSETGGGWCGDRARSVAFGPLRRKASLLRGPEKLPSCADNEGTFVEPRGAFGGAIEACAHRVRQHSGTVVLSNGLLTPRRRGGEMDPPPHSPCPVPPVLMEGREDARPLFFALPR